MDHRKKLKRYIEKNRGYAAAADKLGCSESTLRSVTNGWRGVSSRMAEQWEQASDGQLRFASMARITATKQPLVESVEPSKDGIVTLKPLKSRERGRK